MSSCSATGTRPAAAAAASVAASSSAFKACAGPGARQSAAASAAAPAARCSRCCCTPRQRRRRSRRRLLQLRLLLRRHAPARRRRRRRSCRSCRRSRCRCMSASAPGGISISCVRPPTVSSPKKGPAAAAAAPCAVTACAAMPCCGLQPCKVEGKQARKQQRVSLLLSACMCTSHVCTVVQQCGHITLSMSQHCHSTVTHFLAASFSHTSRLFDADGLQHVAQHHVWHLHADEALHVVARGLHAHQLRVGSRWRQRAAEAAAAACSVSAGGLNTQVRHACSRATRCQQQQQACTQACTRALHSACWATTRLMQLSSSSTLPVMRCSGWWRCCMPPGLVKAALHSCSMRARSFTFLALARNSWGGGGRSAGGQVEERVLWRDVVNRGGCGSWGHRAAARLRSPMSSSSASSSTAAAGLFAGCGGCWCAAAAPRAALYALERGPHCTRWSRQAAA